MILRILRLSVAIILLCAALCLARFGAQLLNSGLMVMAAVLAALACAYGIGAVTRQS